MMQHVAIIIFILVLTVGCADTSVNNQTVDTIVLVSDFDLRSDLLDFSTKMTDLDTLTIFADLSSCTSWHWETNTLTKKGGHVYISGSIDGDFIDHQDKELERVEYDYLATDSLNFENLFRYMQYHGAEDGQFNSQVFTIVHKKDTVNYFSDRWDCIEYYIKIKSRLYPSEEAYKPVFIPEPELP